MSRSFIFGDIHGELASLEHVLQQLPALTSRDTLVFLGDYLDRGPASAQVIARVMALPRQTPARVVALRGNHEDAWLRVLDEGWDNFVATPTTGTLATLRSFVGGPVPLPGELPSPAEFEAMSNAAFFPQPVIAWLRARPFWYENEHGIYLHGALPIGEGGSFPHPREVEPAGTLAWSNEPRFFESYRGKRVVVGHTRTQSLPQAVSERAPAGAADFFRHGSVFAIDTGSGSGGFLTALELPALRVYESRSATAGRVSRAGGSQERPVQETRLRGRQPAPSSSGAAASQLGRSTH